MSTKIELAIRLLRIALTNPEGFTVKLDGSFQEGGYISAVKETQNAFDLSGLERVIEYARDNDLLVGGWLNNDNGQFYWDAVKAFDDRDKAIQFGIDNHQIAIFDLNNFEEIDLSSYKNQAA